MKIWAKKSLGQNFLKSKLAVHEILEAATLQHDDSVLEVGPGKGVLTEALLEKTRRVIAVEKDDRMIGLLNEQFSSQVAQNKLEIVHADILETKPEDIGLLAGQYKIIANIPYYITGQFLRIFLSGEVQPSKMVLMLQKEVAKRIVGKNNTADHSAKESILSISVKAYGMPKYISTVQAKYFSPEPKVDSAILLIDTISKNFFGDLPSTVAIKTINDKEKKFFELVKKGFQHKRKMLAQNLEIPTEKRTDIFGRLGLNEKVRAEDLTLDDWKKMYGALTN